MRRTTAIAFVIYAAAVASFFALVAYDVLHRVVAALP